MRTLVTILDIFFKVVIENLDYSFIGYLSIGRN